jgi:hypothetical protein
LAQIDPRAFRRYVSGDWSARALRRQALIESFLSGDERDCAEN